jgi:hypothetical protein
MNWPHYTDPAWVDYCVAVSEGAVTPCEPPLVSPGLYVAKHSGRRCTVVSVSNWTLEVRYHEGKPTVTHPIEQFLRNYTKV